MKREGVEPLNKPSQIFSRGKKVNIVGFSLLSIMILSSHNLPLIPTLIFSRDTQYREELRTQVEKEFTTVS